MTNLEELLVRLGLDGSKLDQGLRTASSGLKEFGAHASEHMDKAATSGRALHKILDSISDISPGVGLAITAAFSGPMAALELFKLGLGAIKQHYEDIAKAAAEARANAEALRAAQGDFRDVSRGVRGEAADIARSQGYAVTPEQQAGLDARAQNEVDIKVAEENLKQAKAREDKILKERPGTPAGFRSQQENYKVAAAEVAYLDRVLDQLKDTKLELAKADKDAADASEVFEKRAQDEADKTIEKKKKQAEADKEFERIASENADKAIAKKEKEAEVEYQLTSLQKERAQTLSSPYTPGLSELAKTNTPYGQLARLIELRTGQAKAASGYASPEEFAALQSGASANTAQLRSDLAAAGGNPLAVKAAFARSAQSLRGMLGEHGNDPQIQHLQKIDDSMAELTRRAKEEGLVVTPADK
jgi:hypothetical protein